MNQRDFLSGIHQATTRDYLARVNEIDKAAVAEIACQFGPDYWDGDRLTGYGGYNYLPGRWKPVAEALIRRYGLTEQSSVLDVGCGKAFLLYELQLLLPGATIVGFDISNHALASRHPNFLGELFVGRAQDRYPFDDKTFDLVISLATLHNLRLPELQVALPEIERVGRNAYVMVESYRDERELFNLECWALTAESLLDDGEWVWLFDRFGYSGDFEFIYFE